ncbi:ecdysone 20-monooxygenase [Homalodisca vitripennis]|uniref:Cytochrome P450 n=1 Tax=Homalodisca liturata TaxID=320908 RepID=A0A1B6J7Y8_9HEMI|nr:ecdysone 20-monooxygenase [Homalodisca vitripennis]XP_046669600.1 ecdysone 20-monooxygenase [Homalodisca vitripennis]
MLLSAVLVDPLNVTAVVVIVLVLLLIDYRPSWWFNCKAAVQGLKSTSHLRKKKEKKIPGPPALPVIGTRWLYTIGYYKINKIHEVYQDLHRKFGAVVKEEALWNFPVISLFAAEDIEKVLRYPSRYPVRPPTEVIAYYRTTKPDKYTNLGLVNEQGETWHNLRTSLTPALTSAATMQRFLPELNQVADDFNTLLLSSRDPQGVVHSFEELANRMGLESTCTLILGRRMGFLDQQQDPTAARLAQAIQVQFCASRDAFYGLPFWKLFPTAAYKQLIQSEDVIYEVISDLVDSALKEELEMCDMDGVKSVFMSILQSPNLDIRDKKAGIIDFVAAGIKTLGNTLVFLLYLVAKNPRVQKRLYEEIVELAPLGTAVTSQVLRDANYLRACIMEAHRVLPTAPCVARILETDMELSGHHLKPGSVVLCQNWIASQQEQNFKNPNEFLPERWLTDPCPCKTSQSNSSVTPQTSHVTLDCICDLQEARSKSFLVAPFGVGKRMCPGKRFVQLELQVVLAQTVRQFEISYNGELDLQFEFLLVPASNTDFILRDRNREED